MLLAIIWARDARGQAPQLACVHMDKDTVAITGRLERRTYPGPPNYESVKTGDAAETGFYLVLAAPICSQPGATAGGKRNVRLVQLVLDQRGYDSLRPRLGKSVTLRGTMFEAITGHHHAPLLLDLSYLRK